MIEFKAECGHTVRAKDDDGGKVVRCSYCGRDARVPEQQDEVDGDLDFLFRDVEQTAESEAQSPGRRRSRRRSRSRTPFSAYSADRFNPLAVALKMVYVAVILIVVIFVGKKFIYPLFTGEGQQQASSTRKSPSNKSGRRSQPLSSGSTGGLLEQLDPKKSGIYVDSVPEGVRIYIVDPSDRNRPTDAEGILATPACDRNQRARIAVDLSHSTGYRVLCTLPINARGLKDYPEYRPFRQRVESGEQFESLDGFLLPDKAESTGTIEFRDDFLLYRIYEVDVAPKQWSSVIALFLPPRSLAENSRYLPKRKAFAFDKDEAKSEMDFYLFPATDQSFMIQALESMGAMVYHLKSEGENRYYWLRVPLTDGTVKIRLLN